MSLAPDGISVRSAAGKMHLLDLNILDCEAGATPLPDSSDFSGDHTAGEIPLPIPNRADKPRRADGTMWATAWESRSSPGFFSKSPD